jgi:hypothetical protein
MTDYSEAAALGGNVVDSPAPSPDIPTLNGPNATAPLTGQPTSITGHVFDEGRRQDVARRNRARMGQAARWGEELLRRKPNPDDVRSALESTGLAKITLSSLGLERQGNHLVSTNGRLRALPTGSKATPVADDATGVVCKFFPLAAPQTNGVKLAPKNGPDGWTVDSAPATMLV